VTFASPWPNPAPGQADQVVIDDMPMQLVPGKYSVEEADRFGEKVAQGTLKYADFNPYESAHAVAALIGGAGLRRYSDGPGDPNTYMTMYTESSNVNCCFAPAILSPEILYHPLPGATGPAVWIGEDYRADYTGSPKRLLAVAPAGPDTNVYTRGITGTWTVIANIPGKNTPIGTAIGVYQGILVVGFGFAATAVSVNAAGAVSDLTQDASEPGAVKPLYVWAYTSDHATNYIAGGPSSGDYFRVMSSVAPGSAYAKPVSCGDTMITALAPGGGLVLLFVGKVDALGEVDNQAVYHDLIPFDSRLSTNCFPTKWLLASGADQQRGSLTLVFPRERSLWEYAPSDQYSGTASCIAPWSADWRRPPNARGIVTAVTGTSRWLYYAVQNGAGHTWIYRNDQSTGAPHTYLDLSNINVRAMGITHLYPGNPILVFSAGPSVGEIVLPLDGDMELDDDNCRYQAQGYVDIPDIDLGFPDEDKIGFTVRIISDNLVGLNRYHKVQASIDGEAFVDLGIVNTSPAGEVAFPLGTTAKRMSLRIWFYSDDPTQTPQLWGFSLRVSLNTKVYRLFVLQTRVPSGSFSTLADDLQNPYIQILHSWNMRRKGIPVPYLDPWNDVYQVRVLKLQQQEALREPDHTPEWVLDWTLLEYTVGDQTQNPHPPIDTTTFVYDMDWTKDPASHPDQADLYGYDMPLAMYDTQTPA
jgi:hypothetical protein